MHAAHVFTTVSQVTADEAEHLLKRKAGECLLEVAAMYACTFMNTMCMDLRILAPTWDSTGALFMCTNVSIVHEVCVSVLCVCAWSQVFVGVWYSVHVHVHIWYVLCVHVCLVSHAILCYEAAYLVDLILPNGLNVVKFRYVLCNMHCAKFRTFVNLIQ